MKIYKSQTVRLTAGQHDAELDTWINGIAEQGWELHSVSDGVQTVIAGGIRAVDRLLVFMRDVDELPKLLTEDEPHQETMEAYE